MIILYEKNSITVDEKLIAQYLQNRKIAKDFAVYYDLFNEYKSDYQVDTILAGKATEDIKRRAKNGKFDERLALLGLILDSVTTELRSVCNKEAAQGKVTAATYDIFMSDATGKAVSDTQTVIADKTHNRTFWRTQLKTGQTPLEVRYAYAA